MINMKILIRNYEEYIRIHKVLQTQALRVGQVNESCIGLTQENSIESSV